MTTISGFTPIPISYSPETTHYIYARPNVAPKNKASTSTIAAYPDGRTLFLVNVPPDASEREIVLFFRPFGTVERVVFDEDKQLERNESDSDSESGSEDENEEQPGPGPRKRRKLDQTRTTTKPKPTVTPILVSTSLRTIRKTGRTAHIVFLDASSMSKVLSTPHTKPCPWTLDEPTGLSHYTSLHSALRPPLDALKAYVDSSIDLYEYNTAQAKRALGKGSKYRKGEAVVDDDGFTLVTRGGAYGTTLGGGVGVARKGFAEASVSERSVKKKRKRERQGKKEEFYAFQKAEKQRNEIMELERKWEEDKDKIEKRKAARQFRPY